MMQPAAGLPSYTMPPTEGARPRDGSAPTYRSGQYSGDDDSAPPTSGGPIYTGNPPSARSSGPVGNPAPARAAAPAGSPAPSSPAGNRPGGTYGVGTSGGARQPTGGSPAQVSTPPAARRSHGGVPQQRMEGTVYGGRPAPDMPVHSGPAGITTSMPGAAAGMTMPVPSRPADMTMPVPSRPADMTMPVTGNAADMTMPVPMNFNAAMENSGSLTGHILAQGWDRGVDTNRRSNVKVGIAMLLVLLFLVGVSVLFLFTAGDAFTDMLNGVFGGK